MIVLWTTGLEFKLWQSGPCKSYIQRDNYFAVVFDADYNPDMGDPSNNFVGVIDGMSNPIFKPGYTHNLSGNGTTHFSYLSNGGSSIRGWIDLSPQRTLQVWLANGSSENSKPLKPVLELQNFEMPSKLGDYVSLMFLGSSGENHMQAHKLSSWSFSSSELVSPNSRAMRKWGIRPLFWVSGTFATLVVLGFLSLWLTRHRRRFRSPTGRGPRVFSYRELCYATKYFSDNRKLGSVGFGTVYRGSIRSSSSEGVDTTTLVAVKRINYDSKHAERTFLAEISSLCQIRHGNVVRLQG